MSLRNFKSHREMRHKTYLKVIDALKAGINSKRGIQDHSGLSWGSCSPVINNLLSQKVIVDQKVKQRKRAGKGRKTKYFHFNRKKHLLMGMELDASHIKSTVATLGNESLGTCVTEFETDMDSSSISDNITRAFLQCTEPLSLAPESIYCISYSIPGAVDVENKVWQYCERVPGIRDVEFDEINRQGILPQKVYMQHNIHAHAYSVIPINEIEKKDYVFIHVGQGMALSANMDGILYGQRGFAGEIGHIPYPYIKEEIECLCGKRNCLEALLNKGRILEYIRNTCGHHTKSLDRIADEQIKQKVAIEYLLDPLVYTTTIVSNIFDPNRIIIEGSVLEPFYPYLMNELEQKLKQSAWLNGPAEICWCQGSNKDGSYGAILHSSEKIIADFINDIDLDH